LRRTSRKTGKIGSSASGVRVPAAETAVTAVDDASLFSTSNLSLHELFEQQARNMLERADIDEEQRQSILVAMACPCCGAGGMSFSVKLKAEESS
jgi:hypothetical protein